MLENTLQQVKFPNQAQRGHNLHLHCRVLVLHSVTPAAFTDGLTNHTVCVQHGSSSSSGGGGGGKGYNTTAAMPLKSWCGGCLTLVVR